MQITQETDMKTFHFRCLNGDLVTAEADNEPAARSWAMERRWGPATGIYAPAYEGRGLALVGEDGLPIREREVV